MTKPTRKTLKKAEELFNQIEYLESLQKKLGSGRYRIGISSDCPHYPNFSRLHLPEEVFKRLKNVIIEECKDEIVFCRNEIRSLGVAPD